MMFSWLGMDLKGFPDWGPLLSLTKRLHQVLDARERCAEGRLERASFLGGQSWTVMDYAMRYAKHSKFHSCRMASTMNNYNIL